jgi:hypothetical protein
MYRWVWAGEEVHVDAGDAVRARELTPSFEHDHSASFVHRRDALLGRYSMPRSAKAATSAKVAAARA